VKLSLVNRVTQLQSFKCIFCASFYSCLMTSMLLVNYTATISINLNPNSVPFRCLQSKHATKMFGKLSKLDKNLFMFLLFQGKLFGFLPYGVDKTSGELIKSTCLQLFNRVLTFVLICNFVICSFYWFREVTTNVWNPRMLVATILNVSIVVLSTQSYIFVCTNYESIRTTFNNLWKLNQAVHSIKLFSKLEIVQLVLIQPILQLCLFCLFGSLFLQDEFRVFVLNCSVIFICLVRFLMIFFCLMINLTSFLIESEVENSENLQSVLKATEKVCKLFNNFSIVYILIEYCCILTFMFCLFSLLIAFLGKFEDPNLLFLIFPFSLIVNEASYLKKFFDACGALKANVRCSELTRWFKLILAFPAGQTDLKPSRR
jgi:hypothetical protein